MKTLIIDDDQVSRTILVKLLAKEQGVELIEAASAEQALDKLAEGLIPDLILLDLILPEMNGEQFLETLRKEARWEELPIVICSSAADRTRIERVARLGIDGYLLKPIAAGRLREVFREVARTCTVNALLEPADKTMKRLEFSRADYHELLLLFGAEADRMLGEIRSTAANESKDKMKRLLNSLRATAGNIGALAIMAGAEKVADMVDSASPSQLTGMIAQLEKEKQRTDQEILARTRPTEPAAAETKPAPAPAPDGKQPSTPAPAPAPAEPAAA